VARRHVAQRQGGQEGEAQDDAEGDADQGSKVRARGKPLARGEQQSQTDRSGDGGAGEGQEYRIDIRHRGACRRQGAAEDQHAHKPVDPALRSLIHPKPPFAAASARGRMAVTETMQYGLSKLYCIMRP